MGSADVILVWCASGPNNKPSKVDAVSNPKKFFGTTRFGFSKANEVFVGRTGVARQYPSMHICAHVLFYRVADVRELLKRILMVCCF